MEAAYTRGDMMTKRLWIAVFMMACSSNESAKTDSTGSEETAAASPAAAQAVSLTSADLDGFEKESQRRSSS
jgi:hypothetical protein